MSNRVRILFHCALECDVAHIGKQALRAMEVFVQNPGPPGEKWISNKQWIELGRPNFLRRHFALHPNGKGAYKYLVNMPAPAESEIKIPKLGSWVERAKWLWAHLPDNIRQQSQLVVTRESRGMNWRRSKTNPRRHGWQKGSKRPGIKFVPHVPSDYVFAHPGGFDWGTVSGQSGHVQASPSDPAPGTADTNSGVSLGEAETNALEMLKETAPYQTVTEVVEKVKAKVYGKYLKTKAEVAEDFPPPPKPKGNPYVKKAKPPAPAEAPAEKPRLHIGIWA